MTYPQGINFRNTSGYVTDGTGEDYEILDAILGPNYPRTTAQGNTVGYEGTVATNPRNRNSGNDRRLAGKHSVITGTINYRFDLPSTGNYNVRIAAGEANYSRDTYVEAFDTAASLGVLCQGVTGAANSFRDATNTVRTAAAWPGSNAAASLTFSTTICRFKIGNSSGEDALAHLYVESAGGVATTRGTPFGHRGTAFNGGRTFNGIIQ